LPGADGVEVAVGHGDGEECASIPMEGGGGPKPASSAEACVRRRRAPRAREPARGAGTR
jgi:hypothetical protein